jgi:RNA polymerase sigma-70 factor (ECF subfamily)
MTDVAAPDLEHTLERHRVELTSHCNRMLGSTFEAEDAVQETMMRAWRSFDSFDGRAPLRSWLYRIATNVCLDMLQSRKRRALPMDLGPASPVTATAAQPLPEHLWLQPIQNGRTVPQAEDPAAIAASRETIRVAFVATLQHLPPRQRVILILREVLRLKAAEVAEQLGASVASVNSALQRARATLSAKNLTTAEPLHTGDEAQQTLLARYVDAFQRFDIEALVSVLNEDATMSMPS